MSRFYFLVRLLVLALIFTLVTINLSIQAAPLSQAASPDHWLSRTRDAENLPRLQSGTWTISGTAHTNTGSPLVGINVTTEPSAQEVFATDLSGWYSAYVITPSNTYTVSWAKPGYGSLPATTFGDPVNTPIVYQGTLPAQGNVVTVGGLKVGQTYRIVVTGTYQYSIGGGAWADAQWGITGACAPGVFCVYDRHIKFNGVSLAAQNGQDVADPNHEYTFLWTADAPQLQMYIFDSDYRDNSGSLAFEISPENSTSLYQGELSAQGNVVTLSGFQVNQTYRIIMRGKFEFSIGGGSWADAQWTTWSCPSMVLCLYYGAVRYNGVQLAAQNGQDVVDPNHEYTFLWRADAPQLQMYILDSDYHDNSGHLTFEIFNYHVSSDPNVFLPPADDLILNGHFEQGIRAINNWIVSGVPRPVVSIAARHTGRQSAFLKTTAPISLENGLVAYWKLDETNGMRIDASGRGNDLLDTTIVTSATGKIGKAAQFVAANHQYLNLADNADLSMGDIDFTIAGWVYLDAPKTNGVAVSKGEATTFSSIEYDWGYEGYMDRFAGSVGDGSGGGASVIANTFGSPAANQWYFIVFWHDSVNNQLGISVNGVSDVVPYSGGVADGSHEFRLGDDSGGRWWNGRLDEVGFWKRVLTPRELAALYNNSQGLSYPFNTSAALAQMVTIPMTMTNPILSFLYRDGDSSLQNALVAYWPLDETGGGRIDATGRGNNLLDSTTVTSASGKIENAAQFVAANHQYLNLADNADLSTGDIDFTIAGWVYLDAPKTNGVIVAKGDATAFSNFEYALGYAGPEDRFAGSVGNGLGGGASVIANTFGSPTANQWYFVAFWHDSVNNQLGISVNGIADVISYSGGVADGSYEFRLGDDLDGRWWNGRLDEIGFWKRVLTPQELAILYNNGQGLSYPFSISNTGGVLDVQVANGVTTTAVFTTALNAVDWTHQWLDLSAWKGQTITVTFMLHHAEGLPTSVYLDEITLGSGYPDTWVQLANPPVAYLGSTVTYQLTYGNRAGVPASDVQLTTTLPAQLTFVAASVPPTSTLTSLVWDLGDLPAQSVSHTILITAAVTSAVTGVNLITNTASINTATTELEMANNSYQTNLRIKYNVFLPFITREE